MLRKGLTRNIDTLKYISRRESEKVECPTIEMTTESSSLKYHNNHINPTAVKLSSHNTNVVANHLNIFAFSSAFIYGGLLY